MTDAQIAAVAGILATVVGAGMAGKWVWGWVYQDKVKQLGEMTKDRDYWRGIALKAMGHTDKALDRIPDKRQQDDG